MVCPIYPPSLRRSGTRCGSPVNARCSTSSAMAAWKSAWPVALIKLNSIAWPAACLPHLAARHCAGKNGDRPRFRSIFQTWSAPIYPSSNVTNSNHIPLYGSAILSPSSAIDSLISAATSGESSLASRLDIKSKSSTNPRCAATTIEPSAKLKSRASHQLIRIFSI